MEKKLKKIFISIFNLSERNFDVNNCTNNLIEDWDSLRHMNLVVSIEEEFNVEFNDNEVIELNSFNSIIKSLKNKI